jgi:hypothetical protein
MTYISSVQVISPLIMFHCQQPTPEIRVAELSSASLFSKR